MISKEDIINYSEVSMLKFTEEESDELKKSIDETLDQVDILKEVDIEGVEPLYQVYDYNQRLREDDVKEDMMLTRDEVLQNTEDKQYGFFKVMNIME